MRDVIRARERESVIGCGRCMAPALRPLGFELDRQRELRIRWADGHTTTLPLALLRRQCPCAACRSERETETVGALPVVAAASVQRAKVTAVSAELIGQYALRIVWEDGHDTGIYDYELLRRLDPADAGQTSG